MSLVWGRPGIWLVLLLSTRYDRYLSIKEFKYMIFFRLYHSKRLEGFCFSPSCSSRPWTFQRCAYIWSMEVAGALIFPSHSIPYKIWIQVLTRHLSKCVKTYRVVQDRQAHLTYSHHLVVDLVDVLVTSLLEWNSLFSCTTWWLVLGMLCRFHFPHMQYYD